MSNPYSPPSTDDPANSDPQPILRLPGLMFIAGGVLLWVAFSITGKEGVFWFCAGAGLLLSSLIIGGIRLWRFKADDNS